MTAPLEPWMAWAALVVAMVPLAVTTYRSTFAASVPPKAPRATRPPSDTRAPVSEWRVCGRVDRHPPAVSTSGAPRVTGANPPASVTRGRHRHLHLVPLAQSGMARADEPHDGAADLDLFPPSLVERGAADLYLRELAAAAGFFSVEVHQAFVELRALAGSWARFDALERDAERRQHLPEYLRVAGDTL